MLFPIMAVQIFISMLSPNVHILTVTCCCFFFFNNTCFSWGKIASQNFNWHFSSVRAVHNFSVYNFIDYLNIGLLIFPI